MIRMIKTCAIATIACTFVVGAAASQDLDIYIDGGGPRYRDQPRYYEEPRYYDEDDGWGEQQYRRRPPEAYQCTPRQALNKAQRYLRNPRVGRTSQEIIEIRGIGSRGERNRIIFGTRRGCPRIG